VKRNTIVSLLGRRCVELSEQLKCERPLVDGAVKRNSLSPCVGGQGEHVQAKPGVLCLVTEPILRKGFCQCMARRWARLVWRIEKNLFPGAPDQPRGLAELERVAWKLVGKRREHGFRLLGLAAVNEALGIKSDDRRVVVAAIYQRLRDRRQQAELALIAQGFGQSQATVDDGLRRRTLCIDCDRRIVIAAFG